MSFGMRHRAALGVSEESDAIVVVVSEETGAISVFHNAKLKAGLSATELKAELLRLNNEVQLEMQEGEAATGGEATTTQEPETTDKAE